MAKTIPLTQGKVAIVDDEDFEYLSQFKWFFNGHYALRTVVMHRELLETPKGMQTDHINGNTLDNRRANLRICTAAENQHNKKQYTNNTSKYKGVSWHKRDKKWRASIKAGDKRIHLGNFDNPVDAARAYDAAAREHFGEFARVNFPTMP